VSTALIASSEMASLPASFEPGDVKKMFDQLVPGYDRFNRLSSLGLDRRWRKAVVEKIPHGAWVLDVGAGTGDTALMASSKARRVVGVDFSRLMVEAAKRKTTEAHPLHWHIADASRLPFKSRSFDVLTSSFVLRNLYRLNLLDVSFQEACRVLTRGGQLMALDLTRPRNNLVAWGHRVYMGTLLPLVGKALFGKKWPGAYLRTSIREFPESAEILQRLERAGFCSARYTALSGGIAGIFSAAKP
jgi:demethylmenaquinone methyltransferase/2-methoxy-6-polyprenyl-1,4-benzoquinol methylase